MARRSELAAAALLVEAAIRKRARGQGAKSLLLDLWILLETGTVRDTIKRFATAHRSVPIRGVAKLIERSAFALPRAILAMSRFEESEDSALRGRGARRSELEIVKRLATGLGVVWGAAAAREPDTASWVAAESHLRTAEALVLDPRALDDMLFPVVETFLVSGGRGKRYTETYGLCLGMRREDEFTGSPSRGLTLERVSHVTRCVPQMRALGTPTSVGPNEASNEATIAASESLFPHLDVLGDYHSHPYDSLAELKLHRGWELSEPDRSSNFFWVQQLRRTTRHRPSVGFVVAICPRSRRGRRSTASDAYGLHTLQLELNRCQIVVAAYSIASDGYYGAALEMHCDRRPIRLYERQDEIRRSRQKHG